MCIKLVFYLFTNHAFTKSKSYLSYISHLQKVLSDMNKIILTIIVIFFSWNISLGQAKLLNKDSLLQDVEILFSSIEEIHPNIFAVLSEEDFNRDLQEIKTNLKSDLNVFDFYKLVDPLVAKFSDGHTILGFPYAELKKTNGLFFPFPINVNTKDSSITIFKNYSKIEELVPLGAQIISVNNIPIKKLVAEMMTYISGEKDFYKLNRLEYLFTPLLYILHKSNEFQLEYIFEKKKQTIYVTGINYNERYERSIQKKNRKKYKKYSFKQIPNKNIAVVDFRSFSDFNTFEIFLDSIFTIIKNENINNLIIDIRRNGGGNSKLGNEFFQYISQVPFRQFGKTIIKYSKLQKKFYKEQYNSRIPFFVNGIKVFGKKPKLKKLRRNNLRYTGNTFLLISNTTFSSAASFSWAFKYFNMGKVIGQETGGMAVCFGDVIRQKLPYSNLRFGVSHKKFYQYGATDANNHGTIPDYEVPSIDALKFTIDLIDNKK